MGLKRKNRIRIRHWLCLGVFMLGVLFSLACVREKSPITGRSRFYGMSWSQALQQGKDANTQIIEQYGLVKDPQLQTYVAQVGERVLSKSDLRKPTAPAEYRNTPIKFQVLDSPVVNAFAVPGGYIYVTRGLLNHLNNEAQLAVVLGHEIGHVAARHASQEALQSRLGQVGLAAGSLFGAQLMGAPEAAGELMNVGGVALQLLSLKYSRADEAEADQLGVTYAESEGYDASQAARFFESLKRISRQQGGTLPSWLSTHPDPGNREQRVIQLAQQYRRPMQMLVVNRNGYLQRLNGLVMGRNPRDGFVQNNEFYHPDLGFQFPVPPGWKVQNESSAVTLLAPKQAAALIFEPAPGTSPRQAAAQFASSKGLQVQQSTPVQLNGFNAVVVTARANTQQGTAGVLNYFIDFNGRVYSLMGLSSAAQFGTYAPQFQQIARGFSKVTDLRILNVQPTRVALFRVPEPAPFSRFIPTGTIAGLTPQDLAIMNQVTLNQTIRAGTILKVPSTPGGTPADGRATATQR